MRTRLAIEDKLHLEPTQPWVEVPSALLLHSGGRTFEIKVSCHPGYLVCCIQAGMHASSHCSSISLCTLCSQIMAQAAESHGCLCFRGVEGISRTGFNSEQAICDRWTLEVCRRDYTLLRFAPMTAVHPGGDPCSGAAQPHACQLAHIDIRMICLMEPKV